MSTTINTVQILTASRLVHQLEAALREACREYCRTFDGGPLEPSDYRKAEAELVLPEDIKRVELIGGRMIELGVLDNEKQVRALIEASIESRPGHYPELDNVTTGKRWDAMTQRAGVGVGWAGERASRMGELPTYPSAPPRCRRYAHQMRLAA